MIKQEFIAYFAVIEISKEKLLRLDLTFNPLEKSTLRKTNSIKFLHLVSYLTMTPSTRGNC